MHPVDSVKAKQFRMFWKQITPHVNMRWYQYFGHATGHHDAHFVPLDIYYLYLEPALNNLKMTKAYGDKNAYDRIYPNIKKPKVFVRGINGHLFDVDYAPMPRHQAEEANFIDLQFGPGVTRAIIKPAIESGRGLNVQLLQFDNGRLYLGGKVVSIDGLLLAYKGDFVIQECITQHHLTARFNQSSVNSIRVFTYRSVRNEEIIPLHFMQRIGSTGSLTDGALCLGIRSDGQYEPRCYDTSGNHYTSVNGLDLESLDAFPFVDKLREVALAVAAMNNHARLLGIDLAIDESGEVVFVEVNNQSVGIHKTQLSGGPLFKEYCPEVVSYCKEKKRTFFFYAEQ